MTQKRVLVSSLRQTLLAAIAFALLLAIAALVREVRFRRSLQRLLYRLLTFWRSRVDEEHDRVAVMTLVLAAGCESPDDRLISHVAESNRQQAEQNQEMARLHQEVAKGTSRFVDAVAESRQEMLDMERELQNQRSRLENERRSLANARYRESILVPVVSNVGLLLVAALPLVLAWYLLHGLRAPDDETSEVLIREIAGDGRPLLPPREARRAIAHDARLDDQRGAESPPF